MAVLARVIAAAPTNMKIPDKKADASMQGLASMAEMDQWKTDMELVNLAMKGDRSLCLPLVGIVRRWQKREKTFKGVPSEHHQDQGFVHQGD